MITQSLQYLFFIVTEIDGHPENCGPQRYLLVFFKIRFRLQVIKKSFRLVAEGFSNKLLNQSLVHRLLCFNAQGSVRHGTKTGLVNQLACDTTNAVSFIFNSHDRFLKMIDELYLPAGHLA